MLAPRRSAEPTKTLREEFLDHVLPFESPAAAQAAIDGWVESYNRRRPHQSLDMATPASLFRPNGLTRLDVGHDTTSGGDGVDDGIDDAVDEVPSPERPAPPPATSALLVDVIEPPAPVDLDAVEGAAVEFEARVPPSGQLTVRSGPRCTSPWPVDW